MHTRDKIWINIASSFKQAEKFDRDYYEQMSPSDRLEIMQFLRLSYDKINRRLKNAGGKRLRTVAKIIQQK